MTRDELDDWAREEGFLVLIPGHAYEKQVFTNGSVFMYTLDDDRKKWLTAYVTRQTDKYPGKQNIKCQNVSLDKAIEEAQKFVSWVKSTNKGKGSRSSKS